MSEQFGVDRKDFTYSVTVCIAKSGSPLSNGKSSRTGHVWYTVDNNLTNARSGYGFSPENGAPVGEGHVSRTDCNDYKDYDTYVIPVTEEQYNKLINFGENAAVNHSFGTYVGAGHSCVDFTWSALHQAGMGSGINGATIPSQNKLYVEAVLKDQVNQFSKWEHNTFEYKSAYQGNVVVDKNDRGYDNVPKTHLYSASTPDVASKLESFTTALDTNVKNNNIEIGGNSLNINSSAKAASLRM